MHEHLASYTNPLEYATRMLNDLVDAILLDNHELGRDPFLSQRLLRVAKAFGIPTESLAINPYKLQTIIQDDLIKLAKKFDEAVYSQMRRNLPGIDESQIPHIAEPYIIRVINEYIMWFIKKVPEPSIEVPMSRIDILLQWIERWNLRDRELDPAIKKLRKLDRKRKGAEGSRINSFCIRYEDLGVGRHRGGDYTYFFEQSFNLWILLTETSDHLVGTGRKQVWEYMQGAINAARRLNGLEAYEPWAERQNPFIIRE